MSFKRSPWSVDCIWQVAHDVFITNIGTNVSWMYPHQPSRALFVACYIHYVASGKTHESRWLEHAQASEHRFKRRARGQTRHLVQLLLPYSTCPPTQCFQFLAKECRIVLGQ